MAVPHEVRPPVAVYAPETPFSVDVFSESMGWEAVLDGLSPRSPTPVSVGVAEVRLESPFIICPHTVSVVAVKTLPVGNPFREAMKGRASRTVARNGAIPPLVEAIVPVEDMTGSTPGGPIKPHPAGTPIMEVAAQTPPPQKVIDQVGGGLRVHKRIRERQGAERSSQTKWGWVRRGLCPPEIAGLIDNARNGPVEGAVDPIDFLPVARQTESGPLIWG